MNKILCCCFSLALALTAPGCEMLQGLEKPTASVDGVALEGLDLQAVTLKFDLRVNNPYSVALPIAALDYALASRGTPFLDGKSDYQGTIPAQGSGVVPVTARVGFVRALELLKGIRPGAVVPYDAALGISVDPPGLSRLRLPIKTQGSFPIPTLPSVAIKSIKWEELTLARASALIDLEVGNKNQFGFDLAKLAFALTLGGKQVGASTVEKPVSLAAGGSGNLKIPISFSPSSLGLAAFGMLSGSGSGYALEGDMQGTTPFGPLGFPVKASGQTTFSR